MSGKHYHMVAIITTIYYNVAMYTEILTQLDLAKNEAKIYETLLKEGKLGVGHIAIKSKIHRRNVYDSLQRLMEKGLVFEIIEQSDNKYEAVNPKKLTEILEEKQNSLNKIMPDLKELYTSVPSNESVYIYKGIQGWKNYMSDLLRSDQDSYVIGAKGAWSDPSVITFAEQIARQMHKNGNKFHLLYDHHTANEALRQKTSIHGEYRILSKEFSTTTSIDIFGDHVVLLSGVNEAKFNEESAFTVIINQEVADAFRIWFKLLWSVSKSPKKVTKLIFS